LSEDSGFALIELLVALAFASLATMAIVALTISAEAIKNRMDEEQNIEWGLLDVEAATGSLSERMDIAIMDPSDHGFDLRQSNAIGLDRFDLSTNSASDAVIRLGTRQLTADLSAFETTTIEYLVRSPGRLDWVVASGLAGQLPVAARLLLSTGGRTWRPLLWAAPRAAWVTDTP